MRGASEPGEETEFKPGKRSSNRGKRVQVGRGEIRGREKEFEGGGARLPGEKLISRGKTNSSRGNRVQADEKRVQVGRGGISRG